MKQVQHLLHLKILKVNKCAMLISINILRKMSAAKLFGFLGRYNKTTVIFLLDIV